MSGASNRLSRFLVYQAPAILYAAVIFFMSSLPGSEMPDMPFRFGDKLVHALEFGLFGMLLFRAFRFPHSHPNPFRMTLLFGILFAASDEIHQLFVPGRFCEVVDFLADSTGLALFAWISMRMHPLTSPPLSEPATRP